LFLLKPSFRKEIGGTFSLYFIDVFVFLFDINFFIIKNSFQTTNSLHLHVIFFVLFLLGFQQFNFVGCKHSVFTHNLGCAKHLKYVYITNFEKFLSIILSFSHSLWECNYMLDVLMLSHMFLSVWWFIKIFVLCI
jgi:hypothetical protein